jgi:hypothetical protein
VVGKEADETHEAYRNRRRTLLELYAPVAKHLYPRGDHIIAIGVEARDVQARTEDIVFLDATEWTPEMDAFAARLHREGGILATAVERPLPMEPRHYLDAKAMHEFGDQILKMKVGRNDPCPCGSGKKFKTCHGP